MSNSNLCNDCNKCFSTRSSLVRHKEKYCKEAKVITEIKTQNNNQNPIFVGNREVNECKNDEGDNSQFDMKLLCQAVVTISVTLKNIATTIQTHNEQISELIKIVNKQQSEIKKDNHKSANNTLTNSPCISGGDINIKNVNNINNDIKLDAGMSISPKPNRVLALIEHGKETMKNIPLNDARDILRSGYKADVKLFSYIHFNLFYPEYLNIRIDNKKEKYIKFYNGNDWAHGLKRSMIDDIYTHIIEIITDMIADFPDVYNKLPISLKNAIDNVANYDNVDDVRIKNAKENMMISMYDNKNMVIQNYKALQERGFVNRCLPKKEEILDKTNKTGENTDSKNTSNNKIENKEDNGDDTDTDTDTDTDNDTYSSSNDIPSSDNDTSSVNDDKKTLSKTLPKNRQKTRTILKKKDSSTNKQPLVSSNGSRPEKLLTNTKRNIKK